jgi:hypothetical protein
MIEKNLARLLLCSHMHVVEAAHYQQLLFSSQTEKAICFILAGQPSNKQEN